MKAIDFSSMHNVMLRDFDGNLLPMDEPYFNVKKIAEGTWQILSDGDFYYFIEGDDEGMCIDGGYGCGNAREFCQTLTDKPVRRIANTHEHFDHVANNSYFECAYVSKEMRDVILAGNRFPSFGDIEFPTDYHMEIIEPGDKIQLGNRELEVFSFPDHSMGSRAYLDRKARIFFVGDELSDWNKSLRHISVAEFAKQMEIMWALQNEYDICCSGTQIFHKNYVRSYLENARHILAGNEGIIPPVLEPRRPLADGPERDEEGRIVYNRRTHRFTERVRQAAKPDTGAEFRRFSQFAGSRIIYDIRRVYD